MVALYSNGEPLDPNDVAFFLEPFGLHLDALEGIERPSDNAVKADRDMKEWYRAAVPRVLDKLPDGVRKAVVAELAKPLAASIAAAACSCRLSRRCCTFAGESASSCSRSSGYVAFFFRRC